MKWIESQFKLGLRAFGFAVLGLSMGSLLLAACDEDGLFESCPLSPTIMELCESVGQADLESGSAQLTCVVEEHPMCPENVCLMWEGSESVCSRTCSSNNDCPSQASCLPYLNGHINVCVPDSF